MQESNSEDVTRRSNESSGRQTVGGLGHFHVCAAIAAGKHTPNAIRRACGNTVATGNIHNLLANMCKRNVLRRDEWGRFHLTERGREILGERAPAYEMAPYVPPVKAPRRPGSDVASSLPSLYAGRTQ